MKTKNNNSRTRIRNLISLNLLCLFAICTMIFQPGVSYAHILESDLSKHESNVINITVAGKVTDANGNSLPGVTVTIKGANISTATDLGGNFKFRNQVAENSVITFSLLGFKSKEIVVTNADFLTVVLEEDLKQLNEVVVIGYGSQERKDLIGSIAKINADEVKQIPVGSFDAQLQGKAAGLQINSNTGVPGEGLFIRVRGTTSINASNDPLYIVDGVFINNSSLQTVSTGGKATSPIADKPC